MAPPGTIIGQIQATTQPSAIPQATASPTHIQQLQASGPHQIAITQAQQVPLPPSIPPVPKEVSTESNNTDSMATNGGLHMDSSKDNTADGEY